PRRRGREVDAASLEERPADPGPERLDPTPEDAAVDPQLLRRALEGALPPASHLGEQGDERRQVEQEVARVLRHDAYYASSMRKRRVVRPTGDRRMRA